MKAVRIHAHGGPEVMRLEDIELPPPAAGEARICHTAIALNFSDINVRRGGYYQKEPLPMPIILGNEAAGVVTALGPGAQGVAVGASATAGLARISSSGPAPMRRSATSRRPGSRSCQTRSRTGRRRR
jgi:NADPH:quinone reductase-like Zn-dependent oxidoreductase